MQTLFSSEPEPEKTPKGSTDGVRLDEEPEYEPEVDAEYAQDQRPDPADNKPKKHPIAARTVFIALLCLSSLFGVMAGLTLIYATNLPQMEDLARYRPSTTTELLDVKGRVFGSFALERRVVVPYDEFPPVLRQAIISIEDKSFERNWGVNTFRVIGAAYRDLHTKGRSQGASTLTMQLSRNLFLSAEKSYGRKLQEIFLTIQIERNFTKAQIFGLYANQIYLGHGVYGFEAGSEYYFSKHVKDLTLPEAALLAALPKGPEGYSPTRYPDRALKRRNLVISEMLEDGKITKIQADLARATPLGLHISPPPNSEAPYFVEEVRKQLELQYGTDEVHEAGLRVYTTLDLDLQRVAEKAVLEGLATYERRHGWKGHLQNILEGSTTIETYKHPDWFQPVAPGVYIHGLVTQVTAARVIVRLGQKYATINAEDWKWTGQKSADDFLKVGDIVYVRVDDVKVPQQGATSGNSPEVMVHAVLEQDSGAQASLMAVNNANGEVVAMVGGRDFNLSQFNRATQAERQVGSSFKPYVYAAAVEAGAKPEDIIVDGPTTFNTPGGPYTPHNYEGDYKGAMTLVNAFAESRNIPALKLADRVGMKKVVEMTKRFGVTSPIESYLPIAIGAASMTLYEQVASYSVFPNDGIRIAPHYIRKVTTTEGMSLDEPKSALTDVLDVTTDRTMMVFLQAVTRMGTAATAGAVLKHPLGGKTGTTNSYTDAWFLGFSPSVTCGTWIGFDNPQQTLGEKETGARAALPIWIDFMKTAIADKPDEKFPEGGEPKKVLEVSNPVVKPAAVAPPKAAAAPVEDAPAPVAPATPKAVLPAAPPAVKDEKTGTAHPSDDVTNG